MEEKKLRNVIVLKNLPSNLLEEAYVVLKENKKSSKKIQKAVAEDENKENISKKDMDEILKSNSIISDFEDKKYILDEANNVIKNCMDELEENISGKSMTSKKLRKKYAKLKLLSGVLGFGLLVCLILLFV